MALLARARKAIRTERYYRDRFMARARSTTPLLRMPSTSISSISLRRTEPVSRAFGLNRGTPVDRILVERFLATRQTLITGDVLEVGDSRYTLAFGRNLQRVDVLLPAPGPGATVIGDLQTGEGLPRSQYDCFILTQTLQFTFDVGAAVRHARDALRPGGVLLITVPGISQISRYDAKRWGDYWRFTSDAVAGLLRTVGHFADISVESLGNVALACAFLYGVAAEEVPPLSFAITDPDYPVIVGAAAHRTPSEEAL